MCRCLRARRSPNFGELACNTIASILSKRTATYHTLPADASIVVSITARSTVGGQLIDGDVVRGLAHQSAASGCQIAREPGGVAQVLGLAGCATLVQQVVVELRALLLIAHLTLQPNTIACADLQLLFRAAQSMMQQHHKIKQLLGPMM